MPENYAIKRTRDRSYPCVVLSTNHLSPLNEVCNIETSLRGLGVNGKVVFDLLLVNGNNYNRFFEAYFNGTSIEMSSVKILNKPSESIRVRSVEFYKKNLGLLENCILPNIIKFKLRKGILI